MASNNTSPSRKRKRIDSPFPLQNPNTDNKRPFRYRRLVAKDQQQIRLLKLLPGRLHDPLCGSLITTDLKANPEYDAVSYVWGDPTPVFNLIIDGELLKIAENLQKALFAMRLEDESRTLWVDAVCINQDDTHERGHQVQLMRTIYTTARLVRVWLDVDIDLHSPAFRAARRLQIPDGYDRHVEELFPSSVARSRHRPNLRRTVTLTNYPRDFWTPFYQIFSHPYWERVWTQQELFLSRDLIFHFPRGTLRPEPILLFDIATLWVNNIFGHLPRYFTPYKQYKTPRSGNGLYSSLYSGIASNRSYATKLGQHDTDSPHLLNPFLKSSGLKTKDSRDRVFGLIGLAHDCREYTIGVDYRLTRLQTYRMVIEHHISVNRSLNFLCHRDQTWKANSYGSHPEHELPTWLPSPEKKSRLLRHHPWANRAAGDIPFNDKVASATATCNAEVISVRGVPCDVLTARSPQEMINEPVLRWRKDVEEVYEGILSSSLLSAGSVWADEVFLSILNAWTDDEGYRAFSETPKPTILELEQSIRSLLHLAGNGGCSDLTMYKLGWQQTPESCNARGFSEDHLRTARLLTFCIQGGVFLATQNNRLGLCHLCCQGYPAEPGDEVWVLFGCNMPMILRPNTTGTSTRYSVIGPAVIPGLMNGEACQGVALDGNPGPDYKGPKPVDIDLV